MALSMRHQSCAPILQPRIALLHHLPFSARSQAAPRRIRVMAQQTQTSPQEHPHTDPRTNEPSEQVLYVYTCLEAREIEFQTEAGADR
jgi:hypothetical protein